MAVSSRPTSDSAVRFSASNFLISILLALSIFTTEVSAQQTCTQQNPSCAGDSRFNNILCCAPSVCYFQDRAATPGCCPQGQVCGVVGGQPAPSRVHSGRDHPRGLLAHDEYRPCHERGSVGIQQRAKRRHICRAECGE